ncbi:MAG: response regulator, partial [Candidatus Aminicenantes bacterium]|nr:response regulator [Candidatus Aminicenantes bacterium]
MSALIVDDERLARRDLMSLLKAHDQVTVVGEADDVPSAAKAIEKLNPDVIFLDIQMPGDSGFDLLEKADVEARIIFVTAYDEYAIRAFEVN